VYSVVPLEGGSIAFTNRVDNGLYLIDADGSHLKLVRSVPQTNWFSACGRYILFESSRSSTWDMMRIDQDGANPKRLSSGTTWGAACSPDGKFVYYAEALQPRQKIRRLPIDGDTPLDIAENPGDSIPGSVTVSRDGKLLAFPYEVTSPTPQLKIAVLPTTGGPLVKSFDVVGDSAGYIHGPRWSPDGRGLQYLLERNGTINVWEQPLDGRQPRQITKLSRGKIFDFNWTADGRKLALSRGQVSSDVVVLSRLH